MLLRIHLTARLVAIAVLIAAPGSLVSQTPAQPVAGEVFGTIVDAETELPLAGAEVMLEPVAGARVRSTRTDAGGRYRFSGLTAGTYRLRVQRLGYVATAVDVLLHGPASAAVSVALGVAPVRLQPLAVIGHKPRGPANPFATGDDPDEDGEDRLDVERMRQRTNLAPDVRVMTRGDVAQAVPFAESDIFRALQRLPGVAARDDYSAELLTRGGAWDHTRVYFDGVPLFNPVHASAVFSGPSAEPVGGAVLYPGAQPLSTGGGAAASLALTSRSGGEHGALGGSGELSLASARVALDGAAGRSRWMVSARRSHLRRFTEQVESRSRGEDIWKTRHFEDAAGRYDLRLGGRSRVEASALWQHDELRNGSQTDWLREERPSWGSLAARVTLHAPIARVQAQATAGGSGFDARVANDGTAEPRNNALISWPTVLQSRSQVRHLFSEARLEPDPRPGTAPTWNAGAGIAREQVTYDGPPVFPMDSALPPRSVASRGALTYGYAWGERRWTPAPRVAVEAGLRVEGGARSGAGSRVRPGPRLAARWQPAPSTTLSAAAGRTWHTLQAGPELQEQAITQHLWLLAGGATPVLRSDVLTVGAERWLAREWLASASAYVRESRGVALRDPTPGAVMGRQGFVTGRLAARGADASVRKIAGAWTAAASYSWSRAMLHAEGFTYPAESDRRHAVDLEAGARVRRTLRLNAAFSAGSGAAYTRFFGGLASCHAGVCRWEELPLAGQPGGLRAPEYASLDLAADWTHALWGVQVGAYAQLHNALGRVNPARYYHSTQYPHCGYGQPDPAGGCIDDVFARGLPRMPLAGLRLSF